MAAVRVVLPWSTCPIVPTLTCGFVRSNLCFAIGTSPPYSRRFANQVRDRISQLAMDATNGGNVWAALRLES